MFCLQSVDPLKWSHFQCLSWRISGFTLGSPTSLGPQAAARLFSAASHSAASARNAADTFDSQRKKNIALSVSFYPPDRGTVDRRNPAKQLRLVVYPIFCRDFYIQTVVVWDFWTINVGSHFSKLDLPLHRWIFSHEPGGSWIPSWMAMVCRRCEKCDLESNFWSDQVSWEVFTTEKHTKNDRFLVEMICGC